MSRKSDERIYFDSCIYIAHYRKEISEYGKPRIDAIAHLWSENMRGGPTVVTSSLTICEVMERLLQFAMTPEIDDFKNKFRFGQHKLHDVDPIVSERAANYRAYYRKNPVKVAPKTELFSNLTTPDAIHLSTATLYSCQEFWTLDGLSSKPDKFKSIKPLWLNNKVGSDSIIITAPSLPQGVLFTD